MKMTRLIACFALACLPGPGSAIEIQNWKTEKGANVLFVELQSLPMIDIRVVFNAGSARDEIPGTALLTNSLLDTGAAEMDATTVAERLENVGAQMSHQTTRDMAVVSLRSLVDDARLNEALDVLVKVIARPKFPQADFDRERQRLLLSLKSARQQPGPVIQEAFFKALYAQHNYATMPRGTEASVARLLPHHAVHFHQRYYVASNATIAIVGAVDAGQARRISSRISDALEQGKVAAALPQVPPLKSGTRKHITLETKQSHILIGQPVLRRGDGDYFPLYVGNHILGGSGFASVLMQEIREDKGLAYSVYSSFSPMQKQGPFAMGMQTRNDQREMAINLLMENIQQFIQQGPTQEQLDKAVNNITGSAPMRTDSNRKLVEYMAMIGFYGLPLDYLDTFNDKVRQVTIEDIKLAWQRRLNPDKFAIVVVGSE